MNGGAKNGGAKKGGTKKGGTGEYCGTKTNCGTGVSPVDHQRHDNAPTTRRATSANRKAVCSIGASNVS